MKFEGKIIISDIDGTLTGSESGTKKNFTAIKYFTDNGGLFTLATGRMEGAIDMVVPNISSLVNAPAILCNGAYLYDFKTGEHFNEQRLDSEYMIPFISELEEHFPNLEIRVNYRNCFFTPRLKDGAYEKLVNLYSDITVSRPEDMPKDGFDKVVLVGESSELERAREYVLKSKKKLSISKSHSTLLEMLSPTATKGNQVVYLKNMLGGIKTYCIGDYENDENMLKAADVSACPASGLQRIKDLSDITVAECKDGAVADLIRLIDEKNI